MKKIISIIILVSILASCDKVDDVIDDIKNQGADNGVQEEQDKENNQEENNQEEKIVLNDTCSGIEKWDHIKTGTIYKPKSDRQPSRVVFISGPQFQERFQSVRIDGKSCDFDKFSEWDSSLNYRPEVKERAKFAGNYNYEKDAPLRQVWRCPFTCNEVNWGAKIVATDTRQTCTWQVGNNCERH